MFYPITAGYAVYSLFYQEHTSWYSWLVSTAMGFVNTFGFIMMFPQLYINYRTKSVAHLPLRTFFYKGKMESSPVPHLCTALNTFIDDLFAWVLKTPTMYRIACMRDDVVFLIYLYQRWIYPVDAKRGSLDWMGDGAAGEPTDAPLVEAATSASNVADEAEKKVQ